MRKTITLAAILCAATSAMAQSNILNVTTPNFAEQDILTGYTFGSFDLDGGQVYGWTGGSLQRMDKDGTNATDLGAPAGYAGYNSFVTVQSADAVWVGFTSDGNVDDRIYQVDLSGGAPVWSHVATLEGNFDLAFDSAGSGYVVGNPAADSWGGDTRIYLLDPTGADAHDELINVGGYSAGLAISAADGVLYGPYGANALYEWSAADLAEAVGMGPLGVGDGVKLFDLPASPYDIAVDDAGNIVCNANGATAGVYRWDGTHRNRLADGQGGWANWMTMIDVEGVVTSSGGGKVYQMDANFPGIAEVTVPEPATLGLLAAGALALIRRRRT
jgi:hypothetical protein